MYSNKTIGNITQILTAQQISDIDTISLEEKIQQLQSHPHIQFYPQILGMAKLQLIERQKIQQFGRKLLNDQLQIAQIPDYPEITPQKFIKKEPVIFKSKIQQVTKQQRKKQISELLKKSAVSSDAIFIGRPAVSNYRYVPKKPTPIQPKKGSTKNVKKPPLPMPKKNTLPVQTKNNIVSLPSIKNKESNLIENISNLKEKEQKIIEQLPIVQILKQAVIEEVIVDRQEDKQQKVQKIQKQLVKTKKQQKPTKIQIKYIQNDVYDGIVVMEPQKLTDIAIETQTEIQETKTLEDVSIMEQIPFQNTEIVQQIAQKKYNVDNSLALQFQSPSKKQMKRSENIFTQQLFSSPKLTPIIEKTQRVMKKDSLQIQNKYKSQSVKKIEPVKSNKKEESQIIELIPIKSQFKKQQRIFSKTKASFKPPPSAYFHYHQVIPNFNKLFPHSKNLITDLRVVQEHLQSHIKKDVTMRSKSDEYLQLRESQLLFKVVSEAQKANKYSYLFDIDLTSFQYKSKIMLNRINRNNQSISDEQSFLYRVVRQKQDVYDIVNSTFHRTNNWFQVPHGMELKTASWNLLWTWSKPLVDLQYLFYFQKINHFFGNKQIARKDLLKKNIEKIKKLGKKARSTFDIIPQTFFLPSENMQFVRKFRQCAKQTDKNFWILKPVGLSRGRGIELISKIQDIVFSEPIILQKYLPNPLLLDGYKFDMRIYVLVTSIKPLQAYVYKEGFARISTHKYSMQEDEITDKLIHLTNFSVQKDNVQNTSNTFEKKVGGCKITLKMLKQKLIKVGISWQNIQSQINSIVIKSLIACMNSIEPNPNCFELFGYDIIVDDNLKCWLIQVNSSPSLEKQFLIDQILKQQLVDDVMDVVKPIPYDRQRLLQVVSRRRKQLQGLKSHINTNNNSTNQLNCDLGYILHGREINQVQDRQNKNFTKVIPGEAYSSIIKVIQQYKIKQL